MVKHVEKVNMVKKNIKNKKSSVVSALLYRYISRYVLRFEKAYENNSRNLQTK